MDLENDGIADAWETLYGPNMIASTISRPFRADVVVLLFPRAMPWASILSPFRAKTLLGLGLISKKDLR